MRGKSKLTGRSGTKGERGGRREGRFAQVATKMLRAASRKDDHTVVQLDRRLEYGASILELTSVS